MKLPGNTPMDALFQEWRERRGKPFFSNDGILIQEAWERSSPKIAFLLKESNDQFYEIRGKAFKPGPGSSSRLFWRNLNMWAYTVAQFYSGSTPIFDEAYTRKEDLLQHVAYVNLKKTAENRSRSVHSDLQAYVDEDWHLIERQLALINPDIIFCCGTYRYVAKHLPLARLGNRVYRREHNQMLVIDFYHPSARMGYRRTFDRLSQMLGGLTLATPPNQTTPLPS